MSEVPVHDPFQPTWRRSLLAVTLAVLAYALPQQVPLEYFSLNNPSSGLNYLEITCAANVRSETQFYLNTGRGFNEQEKIRLPIAPSQSAYTYTFPLPDAPLIGLRLDPFLSGAGDFSFTRCRIINRRGEEIRRLTRDDLLSPHQIDTIAPLPDGGGLLQIRGPADDPSVIIDLHQPVIPEGMNGRNLQRCLRSCGYLALMLWLLLLTIYIAWGRWSSRRRALRAAAFLAFVALGFAIAANRGLIKNSLGSAHSAARILRHAPAR